MLIGQRLGGKYEIQAEIGRGGMGIVYRGFDIMLQRAVAVKVLPREFTYDPQFVQRFRQEAIMAAGLHHPGIVTIHDVGEQEGVHYIVMQLLEGVTLDAWVGSHGPMPLPQTNHIVRQVAEALDYAHGRGIVHRDIKPSNIMVDHAGQATVMDFGLVRAGEGTGLTRSGTVVGTPEYMAPEQALGQPVDGRTDIYSLGVVIYKMLSGHVPFTRSTSMAVAYAHVHEPPPLLRDLRPDLPKPVEAVVLKALAKRPEERYQQAGHLADHFTVAITGKMPTGLKAVPTPPPVPGGAAVPAGRGATPPSPRPISRPASGPAATAPVPAATAATQLSGRGGTMATAIPARPAARRPLGLWLAGLAVVMVLIVMGAVLALRGGSDSSGGTNTPPPANVPAISLPSATRLPSIEMTSPPAAAPVGEATSTATRTASPTSTRRPATATPTATRLAPTVTPIRTLKATSTATSASAIATPRPIATATSTRVPPTAAPPTQPPTAVPPTQPPTSVPPTQPPPPTNTPIPEPTNTPVPEATNTPVP